MMGFKIMIQPQISINIITYNRSNFIGEAIESVLVQSFNGWELVIINDGSNDNTESIANEYSVRDARIRYIKNDSNLGISRSRNIGLKNSNGKYISVLDSDDIWMDVDKLKKQVSFLENNREYVLVGGRVVVIDERDREISRFFNPLTDAEIRQKMLLKNPFIHSGVLFLKEVAQKLGGYNESINISEDYDLWLRMGRIGKLANLEDYLVKYRKHSGSVCITSKLKAAKNTKTLIERYKNDYPHYWKAWLIANIRVIFYSFN